LCQNAGNSGKASTDDQPIFLVDWIQDFPDASDFLNTLFNSSNRPQINTTMYSNKQVDDWLNKAQVDKNESERYDLYQKVTEQVMNDAPWVPLYYPNNDFAVQPWVHRFYINQSLADPLQYLWIDKSHR
jgi:oligopeptide transport system substrate-binding protein